MAPVPLSKIGNEGGHPLKTDRSSKNFLKKNPSATFLGILDRS